MVPWAATLVVDAVAPVNRGRFGWGMEGSFDRSKVLLEDWRRMGCLPSTIFSRPESLEERRGLLLVASSLGCVLDCLRSRVSLLELPFAREPSSPCLDNTWSLAVLLYLSPLDVRFDVPKDADDALLALVCVELTRELFITHCEASDSFARVLPEERASLSVSSSADSCGETNRAVFRTELVDELPIFFRIGGSCDGRRLDVEAAGDVVLLLSEAGGLSACMSRLFCRCAMIVSMVNGAAWYQAG